MAMDLWSTGVDVKLITPGGVDTEIWDQPGNDPAPYHGPLAPPAEVAADICDAMLAEPFETYTPDMKAVAEFKTSDIDTYMAGTIDFLKTARDEP